MMIPTVDHAQIDALSVVIFDWCTRHEESLTSRFKHTVGLTLRVTRHHAERDDYNGRPPNDHAFRNVIATRSRLTQRTPTREQEGQALRLTFLIRKESWRGNGAWFSITDGTRENA
jgi:hypothetical protein